MSLLKFPGIFFLEVVPLLFNESALKTMPDTPLYRFEEKTGLHHFVFDGGEWASDSAEELVEIAIREIERSIKALILKNGPRPYVTLQLATDVEGPSVVVKAVLCGKSGRKSIKISNTFAPPFVTST